MTIITGSEIWNIIISLGAAQGFILSTLLFLSKRNQRLSNRLLAALIFLLALACTNLYITESDLYEEYATLQVLQELFPFIMVMPVGPLIYFYVQSLTEKDFRLRKKQKWHFLPALIDLLPKLLLWVFLLGILSGWVQPEQGSKWGNFIDDYNTYMDVPRWFSITLYLLLTKRFLKRRAYAEPNPVAPTTAIEAQFKWIHQFLNAFLIFQAIWLAYLIPYINPATRGDLLDSMSYYPIYIPLAILVYWLGFKGYAQTHMQAEIPAPKTDIPEPVYLQAPVTLSSFSPEEVKHYIATLKQAMEKDSLYLEPTLNLLAVAMHTGIPQKTISYVLNNHLHKSFNEFINEYRIAEVKKRLIDREHEHLTISGIALDCGFNSQATFQRAFKNNTGVSPKEYLSLQTQQSA